MLQDYEGQLTVEKSRELLANNHTNRPIKSGVVKRYTRQIKKDRWTGTPVPIIVTDAGRLVDGQHRCLGVVAAGKPIQVKFSIIPDGRYEDVYRVLDIGASRSLSDALRADKNVVQPVSYLLRAAMTMSVVEADDIEPFLDSELGDILTRLVAIKSSTALWRKANFRAATAMAILAGKIEEEKAVEIVETLCTAPITDWHPLFAKLYIQLTSDGPKVVNGRSLESDLFMRSYFVFSNCDKNITSIRCYQSFRNEMKADVFSALYQASPETFD
ncbi:MAG: hypothetical protein ACPHDJ_04930 [Candidatus Puniceispirillaceae bacterium]